MRFNEIHESLEIQDAIPADGPFHYEIYLLVDHDGKSDGTYLKMDMIGPNGSHNIFDDVDSALRISEWFRDQVGLKSAQEFLTKHNVDPNKYPMLWKLGAKG